MKNKIGALAFVLAVTACGGSTAGSVAESSTAGTNSEAQTAESDSESTAESAAEAPAEDADATSETVYGDLNSAGVCGLLTEAEIRGAVGKTPFSAQNSGGTGLVGSCTWEFGLVGQGVYADMTRVLVLEMDDDTFRYDLVSKAKPDLVVDGVGPGAVKESPGELLFLTDAGSAYISTFLLFDNGEESKASRAVDRLALIIIERLE